MSSDSDLEASNTDSEVEALDDRGVLLRHRGSLKDLAKVVERGHDRASLPTRYLETCRAHVFLALSVGFWVAAFGLPVYNLRLHATLFGQRDVIVTKMGQSLNDTDSTMVGGYEKALLAEKLKLTCSSMDVGKMRNVAPEGAFPKIVHWKANMSAWDQVANTGDIWCGYLPRSYVANWPNVAQFIIFTVYKNTGTTINNAFRGIFGTGLAALNMEVMMLLFPEGGRGHMCMWDSQGVQDDYYTVVWYNKGAGWHQAQYPTEPEAVQAFLHTDQGGLTCRAIFNKDGTMSKWLHWASSEKWAAKMQNHYESLVKEKCTPGTMVYNDPNYGAYGVAVCFFDVGLVLFLFLITKSSRSTIMWGMLWHVSWMMSFMNPSVGILKQEDDEERGFFSAHASDCAVVFFTTILGAIFAIIATLLPGRLRLRNASQLHDDCMSLTDAITKTWFEVARYFTGDRRTAKRWQLENHIKSIEVTASDVNEHLQGAWWETCDCGSAGNARYLMELYFTSTVDIRSTLMVVKKSVLAETFGGEHSTFMAKIRNEIDEVVGTTTGLMWLCVQATVDGVVDDDEVAKITEQVDFVKEKERSLLKAFQDAAPGITEDLSDEQIFVFCLGCWSRKVRDFGQRISKLSRGKKKGKVQIRTRPLKAAFESIRSAWSLKDMMEKEHVKYALRNWSSIMIVFLMGYFMHGSIFTRYNATMAVTLTLLFVKEGSHVVDYENSTQRLLGVALGSSMPILIAGVIDLFPCMTLVRFLFQGGTIWLFVFVWMFVYFNSDAWGYVASLVAGVGIYKLMDPCGGQDGDKDLAQKYKDVGNAMVAIIVQSSLHALCSKTGPKVVFRESLHHLLDSIHGSFEALFDDGGDVGRFKECVAETDHHLSRAKLLISECEPKLQFVKGRSPPFKMHLAKAALDYLDSMVSEMRLIVKACEDWKAAERAEDGTEAKSVGVLELVNGVPAMTQAENEIMPAITRMTQIVPRILNFEAGAEQELKDITAELRAAPELYSQLTVAARSLPYEQKELTDDIRMRLSIVVSCLQNCATYLGNIEQWCLTESAL